MALSTVIKSCYKFVQNFFLLKALNSMFWIVHEHSLSKLCRIYDKEGLGYITTETLSGLISELLAPLSEEVQSASGS